MTLAELRSIPSEIWNQICGSDDVLCVLCIDERLKKSGLKCDEAEFYFNGKSLKSKLYDDSHGNKPAIAAAALEGK